MFWKGAKVTNAADMRQNGQDIYGNGGNFGGNDGNVGRIWREGAGRVYRLFKFDFTLYTNIACTSMSRFESKIYYRLGAHLISWVV